MVDILDDFPGWTVQFDLMPRQEQSRHTSGRTRAKDLGDPIWSGTWLSKELRPNELDRWRAILDDLAHRQEPFDGYPLSRCRPILHPAGVAVPSGITVNAVGVDNRSLSLSGATGLNLAVGDMVQVGETPDLYRVMTDSASGASFTTSPSLWPGTAPGDDVSVLKPHCLMTIEPGSVSTAAGLNGRGTVSFRGVEARG